MGKNISYCRICDSAFLLHDSRLVDIMGGDRSHALYRYPCGFNQGMA